MSILTIPNIIKETSENVFHCSIRDVMFQRREIELIGEINAESVYSLILQLRQLQHDDPETGVTMFMNSPGGEVSPGLALYDVMQAVSYPIRTVCVGSCASMASILFAAGTERLMLKHSKLMIHDPLISSIGGSALKIKTFSDDLMETRKLAANILAKHTGKSLEEIYEKTAMDSYFDAGEAIAFGLADRVIDHL